MLVTPLLTVIKISFIANFIALIIPIIISHLFASGNDIAAAFFSIPFIVISFIAQLIIIPWKIPGSRGIKITYTILSVPISLLIFLFLFLILAGFTTKTFG